MEYLQLKNRDLEKQREGIRKIYLERMEKFKNVLFLVLVTLDLLQSWSTSAQIINCNYLNYFSRFVTLIEIYH